jgi:NADH-quinone oxidoreductase subunit L
MFHLFTHAFFKALLFLGCGLGHPCLHHEQDMRYYGGLREKAHPDHLLGDDGWARWPSPASASSGVVWFRGLLFQGRHAGSRPSRAGGGVGQIAFWVGVFAALLTSFYSWRLMFLTFYGKPRWEQSEHIQHAVHDDHGHGHDDHAHAAQGDHHHDAHHGASGDHHTWVTTLTNRRWSSMLIPLYVLLSIGAAFSRAGCVTNISSSIHEQGLALLERQHSLAYDGHGRSTAPFAHEVPLVGEAGLPLTVMRGRPVPRA